jgi:hypothetical protein
MGGWFKPFDALKAQGGSVSQQEDLTEKTKATEVAFVRGGKSDQLRV